MDPREALPPALRPVARRPVARGVHLQGQLVVAGGPDVHRRLAAAVADGARRVGHGRDVDPRARVRAPRDGRVPARRRRERRRCRAAPPAWDLDQRRPASFAVERARGWTETADSPPAIRRRPVGRAPGAAPTMQKPRPGAPGTRLLVRGWYAAHRGSRAWPRPGALRRRADDGPEQPLAGVQWADWARDGRLLVATTAGELQVRDDPRSPQPSWRPISRR